MFSIDCSLIFAIGAMTLIFDELIAEYFYMPR